MDNMHEDVLLHGAERRKSKWRELEDLENPPKEEHRERVVGACGHR